MGDADLAKHFKICDLKKKKKNCARVDSPIWQNSFEMLFEPKKEQRTIVGLSEAPFGRFHGWEIDTWLKKLRLWLMKKTLRTNFRSNVLWGILISIRYYMNIWTYDLKVKRGSCEWGLLVQALSYCGMFLIAERPKRFRSLAWSIANIAWCTKLETTMGTIDSSTAQVESGSGKGVALVSACKPTKCTNSSCFVRCDCPYCLLKAVVVANCVLFKRPHFKKMNQSTFQMLCCLCVGHLHCWLFLWHWAVVCWVTLCFLKHRAWVSFKTQDNIVKTMLMFCVCAQGSFRPLSIWDGRSAWRFLWHFR